MEATMAELAKNGKKLKDIIAEQSGVEKKDLNDSNLKEASKALEGAKQVADAGQDPTKVPVQQLKQVATGEADTTKPGELSTQQKIAMTIAAIGPALMGYAMGGAEGGAAGGQAGVAAANMGIQGLENDRKMAHEDAIKKSANDLKLAELRREHDKDANSEKWKQKEFDQKGQQFSAEQGNKNVHNEMQLSSNFVTNQLVKDTQDSSVGIQKIREAFADQTNSKNPNQFNDMALIFNYMKVLDPGSVVREGEYATAQKNAGLLERMGVSVDKIKDGSSLSVDQRQKIAEAAELQFDATLQKYHSFKQSYDSTAQRYGLNPENVTHDFGANSGQKVMPPKQAASGKNDFGMKDLDKVNLFTEKANANVPPVDLNKMSIEELKAHKKKLLGGQ